MMTAETSFSYVDFSLRKAGAMKQSPNHRQTPSFCSFSEAYREYSQESSMDSGKEDDEKAATGNWISMRWQKILDFIRHDIFQSGPHSDIYGDVRG
jgi:hypothetical protein